MNEKEYQKLSARNEEANKLEGLCLNKRDRNLVSYFRTGMSFEKIGECMGCTRQGAHDRYQVIKRRNFNGLLQLKKLARLRGFSSEYIAGYLEICTQSYYNKLKGKTLFKTNEIQKLVELFDITETKPIFGI